MHRYILEDTRHVLPFNEPASKLTIGTQLLSFHQEDLLATYFRGKLELGNTFHSRDELPFVKGDAIVYRDSLWFDQEFFSYFMDKARATKSACRAAFPADDKAFTNYTLPLTADIERGTDAQGNEIYLLDLWYFPNGYVEDIVPISVPSGWKERGFYSVPDFMAQDRGDLTHYLPERAVLSIESWVHVYYASVIFGVFTRGSRFEDYINTHNFYTLKMLWRAIIEQKQVLTTSEVIKMGKNCSIDPSAIINGPAVIGDNCTIGPGAVIDNCSLGNNVNISQGCQLMLSTVGNNSFLPFRASLFMTSMMDNSILAQNTCLQMCVVGRNSFIGAGTTFTDFNLIGESDGRGRVVPRPIKAANIHGDLENVGQVVLGGAVGHNCRIGSGMIMFPGRMIESDVVLVASPARRIITRNVSYEESDHHALELERGAHQRQYPRENEVNETELTWERW